MSPRKPKKVGRLSYLDQREYDSIEERIITAEEEKERLEAEIADPEIARDPDKLQLCWRQLEEIKAGVDGLYRRWDELESEKGTGVLKS